MEKLTIIVVVLAVLVLISIVQAVQLTGLKEKVSNDFEISKTSQTVTVTSGSASSGGGNTPTSLDDLDIMVGGC